jgi:HSP20 family protein
MAINRRRTNLALAPWRPMSALDELEHQMDDIFGLRALRRFPMMEREWVPAMEMIDKGDQYIIKAELPGMKEEDVDVSLSNDILTVKGEKKSEKEVKEEDYYFSERGYGSFSRSLSLPSDVDAKKVEADFEDGVLKITLPKMAEVKSEKIQIKAAKKEKISK